MSAVIHHPFIKCYTYTSVSADRYTYMPICWACGIVDSADPADCVWLPAAPRLIERLATTPSRAWNELRTRLRWQRASHSSVQMLTNKHGNGKRRRKYQKGRQSGCLTGRVWARLGKVKACHSRQSTETYRRRRSNLVLQSRGRGSQLNAIY